MSSSATSARAHKVATARMSPPSYTGSTASAATALTVAARATIPTKSLTRAFICRDPRPQLTSTAGAQQIQTSSDHSRARPRTPWCVTSLRISRTGNRQVRSNKVGSARTALACPLSFAQPRNGGFCGFLVIAPWVRLENTIAPGSIPGRHHPASPPHRLHHRTAQQPRDSELLKTLAKKLQRATTGARNEPCLTSRHA